MSDYTPTTDDVRAEYIDRNMFPVDRRMAREAFDRWLAAHDAVVRAMAFSEDRHGDCTGEAYVEWDSGEWSEVECKCHDRRHMPPKAMRDDNITEPKGVSVMSDMPEDWDSEPGVAYVQISAEYNEPEPTHTSWSGLDILLARQARIQRLIDMGTARRLLMRAKAIRYAQCICEPVGDPYNHFGIVEPGGALVPDPDCAVHFKKEV